ncbi:MAG: trimethylamine methyltransferase family protein, partial [Steroidobacteraceae bacterium]
MESRRRREGGRGRRAAPTHLRQLPWRTVRNPYAPMEVLTADQLEAIHLTSLRILEELGVELRSPAACDIMRTAGAQVDATGMVRIDRALVERALATAPRSF